MRSNVRIDWHDQQVMARVRMYGIGRMGLAADYLVAKIRENVGTPAPPHSPPGQYPHRMTGELQASIGRQRVRDGYHIYAAAPHAKIVEMRRPYLRRTLAEEQRQVVRIVMGK